MDLQSNKKVIDFRLKIQALKRKLIDSTIYTSQDNKKLNEVKSRFTELYELLYPVLRKKQPFSAIQSVELQEYLKDIFNDIEEDYELLDTLHYYAYRDLIMFPMTLDTVRINSFSDTNSLKNVQF